MAAALRACGWLFLRGRRPTNALAERLLACARGEARYAKLRGGVGVIDTVKTRAIADFLPEVREFLWLNNPCACNNSSPSVQFSFDSTHAWHKVHRGTARCVL